MKRATPIKKSPSRLRFVGEVIGELRKVNWPTRQEAIRLTIMVLVVCVAMGLILWAVDQAFHQLVKEVFLP